MLFFSVIACTEPPVIDPVEEALANRVLDVAEPQIRLFVAIAGVIAESCTVDRVSEHTFSGDAAQAMAISMAEVTESEAGDKTWTFDGAGLDAADGLLVLNTDTDRADFTATFTSSNDVLASGEYRILSCESIDGVYTANVSGNLDVTTASTTNHLYIDGDKPYSSLTWSPPTTLAPLSGWVHWGDTELNPSEEVTLEGASEIDYTSGVWPGNASGARWARTITVALP